MDIREIYARASDGFAHRVHAVDERWDDPTPLPGWDVRELVHHLVHEQRWAVPLLFGATIEEVGARFDGELLGDDPVTAFDVAAAGALAAVRADDDLGRTVHLSFGDHPAGEYVMQLAADHLVHTWDLARALGTDETLDPDLVDAVGAWFGELEAVYREMGVIGPRVDVDGGAQERLLGRFGRQP